MARTGSGGGGGGVDAGARGAEESVGLLSGGGGTGDDYEGNDYFGDAAARREGGGVTVNTNAGGGDSQGQQLRHSSLLHSPRTPRTPRTPNRVRFNLQPTTLGDDNDSTSNSGGGGGANGHAQQQGEAAVPEHHHYARESFDILDDEDPLYRDDPTTTNGARRGQQRQPFLTDITAPSVQLANSGWTDTADDDEIEAWAAAERARPKSGLRMAFMNMANSIIGAGIIGQPYAFKQAGLLAGIVLLVGLTFVVDWTICLIVVNSKLSGANSFQGTVEHCFGKKGLIAISLAQWIFAFGGMVAFNVIVGDSIPHVLTAVWPGLRDVPVLGMLANRKVVIVVFVMGISYPLALYRDIAKVRFMFLVVP